MKIWYGIWDKSTLVYQREIGIEIGEQRGIKIGAEKGRSEGIKLGMRDAVTKFLANGMDKAKTAKMLGLTLKQLEELIKG